MLTPRQRFLALLTLCLTLLALVPAQAAAARTAAAARNPVVFVHGHNADPGVWGSLRADFVGHSFGSLVGRWCVKCGGGTATVDHWISPAGPHHRTSTAWGVRAFLRS
ncbi:hypothetical protein [Streptomyces sp. NPDC001389]|uniref:hypothetical protein n=1 Tax=unclassified Streptomyces TaxID=2593676 RepID=UPI0036CE6245